MTSLCICDGAFLASLGHCSSVLAVFLSMLVRQQPPPSPGDVEGLISLGFYIAMSFVRYVFRVRGFFSVRHVLSCL